MDTSLIFLMLRSETFLARCPGEKEADEMMG